MRPSVHRALLSRQECWDIVACAAMGVPSVAASVVRRAGQGNQIDPQSRIATLRWLEPDQGWKWLYGRLDSVVRPLAGDSVLYSLGPENDRIQISEYQQGAHFEPHIDGIEDEDPPREISAICLLSPPDAFEGGALMAEGPSFDYGQGDLVLFGARVWHGVQPVTNGVRWSLTRWWRRSG